MISMYSEDTLCRQPQNMTAIQERGLERERWDLGSGDEKEGCVQLMYSGTEMVIQ